jgi:TetR/AcrR family transcriptional regulator
MRREQDINYILDVAESLFAEKGFVRVTMRELAQKAEFALGTIYSFFKGKHQLYERLMDRGAGEYVAAIRAAMRTEAQPVRRLEKFIEAKLRFAYQNPPFLRLHLARSHGAPTARPAQAIEGAREGGDTAVFRELVGTLRKGVSSGAFIRADPTALAVAVDGLTTAVALPWLRHTSDKSPDAEIEMAKQVLLKGMLKTAPNQ